MNISYKHLCKVMQTNNFKIQSLEHTVSSFDSLGFFAWDFGTPLLSGCSSAKVSTVLFKEDIFNKNKLMRLLLTLIQWISHYYNLHTS